MFERVIFLSQSQNEYTELVNFLLMARKSIKDSKIDSELIHAYAKNGERFLPDLESFVSEPNQADAQKSGDRCFDDRLYLAAEILYKRISNNQKLA
jgi:clathrin heavy chain